MAGAFTSVDLSQLPAPDVVEQFDFETILADTLADLRARYPEFSALVESDPAYKVAESCAYREVQVRQRANEAARAMMLAYATGADLDNLAAPFDVTRLTITPADPDNNIPAVMESDADFRYRVTLAPEGFAVAGPTGAYEFHARSASADVLDASATSPAPCEVVVSVLSRNGDGTADQALLDAVSAALDSDDVRPLTDQVTVQSATIVPFDIAGTRYTFAGPDSAVVLAASDASLAAYLADSRKLGRDVTMSALYAAIHVPGIQRVTLTSPPADVVTDRTQAAYCASITLDYGGTDE